MFLIVSWGWAKTFILWAFLRSRREFPSLGTFGTLESFAFNKQEFRLLKNWNSCFMACICFAEKQPEPEIRNDAPKRIVKRAPKGTTLFVTSASHIFYWIFLDCAHRFVSVESSVLFFYERISLVNQIFHFHDLKCYLIDFPYLL